MGINRRSVGLVVLVAVLLCSDEILLALARFVDTERETAE